MKCKYEKVNGSTCDRKAFSERGLCLLHEDWEHKDEAETRKQFDKEMREGIRDFAGCILPEVDLSEEELAGTLCFERATIKGDANFRGATIKGGAYFREATIEGDAYFGEATIKGDAYFGEATIKGHANFGGATIKGDANFRGATIKRYAYFWGATMEGNAYFGEATIEGDAYFGEATIEGHAYFGEATIKGHAYFWGATIKGYAGFLEATMEGNAYFGEATIEGDAYFGEATIKGDAYFGEATIKGDAYFREATIEGDANFGGATIKGDAYFGEATIKGNAYFGGATLGGSARFLVANVGLLTFVGATFRDMEGQESACREARMTQERAGNRQLADYHFFREMEAKRKQRVRAMRWLELPLQYLFGYGVYPSRIVATWLSAIALFALIYWIGKGVEGADSLLDYVYFSVVTAATPGYGGYAPEPGVWQGLASFQAILGTFMWAALIATFARKFMR